MKKQFRLIIIIAAALLLLGAACAYLYFGVSPSFTLNGDENTEAQVSLDYSDNGCTAEYLWLDISDKIETSSNVDTKKLGEYTVEYILKYHGRTYRLKRSVNVVDTTPPLIALEGDDSITVSSMSFYKELGYTATDNYDGDISENVKVHVSEIENDVCVITYTVSDSFGNKSIAERTVLVKDIVSPTLTLNGDAEAEVNTPDFADPGCTAVDDLDGDISENITVSTDYQRGTEGRFTFKYTVSDAAGNTAEALRTVNVRDIYGPEIRLAGGAVMYICVGDTFVDPGCSAIDAFEGDVSGSIAVCGSPDTSAPGEYIITYSASDSKGNTSQAVRTVKVYERSQPVEGAVNGGGIVSDSTVYLTFDDGPSNIVTPRVLDILRDNNVKATFFIVNYSEENKWLISRMISEGHTVGIHGYSHDYASIYSSVDAFINNIETLRQRLANDFGYSTNLIRFPGGSSNMVSSHYTPGIMSELCPLLESMGYSYFDWNVSSGDAAGGCVSSGNIYSNVVNGLRYGRGNVVLMHDTNAKGTTADALQGIINFGYANGYTFAALSSYSDGAHHNIQN